MHNRGRSQRWVKPVHAGQLVEAAADERPVCFTGTGRHTDPNRLVSAEVIGVLALVDPIGQIQEAPIAPKYGVDRSVAGREQLRLIGTRLGRTCRQLKERPAEQRTAIGRLVSQ